jgi:hypothetical protein
LQSFGWGFAGAGCLGSASWQQADWADFAAWQQLGGSGWGLVGIGQDGQAGAGKGDAAAWPVSQRMLQQQKAGAVTKSAASPT